jgi:hypothetical protein
MTKSDATTAAYRVASTQMTSAVKKSIITVMEKKGQSSDRITALKEMLDTKAGEALVSAMIGITLTYAPMISNDPRAQKLAEEFRVNGIATAGNMVADVMTEHLMPILMNALSSIPEMTGHNTAVRVAEPAKTQKTETTPVEEVAEEKTATPKTMTA